MNRLKLLKDGLKAIQEFSNEQDKLEEVLRILSPSGVGVIEFGSKFIDQYIQTLSDALGDDWQFISWYVFENEFGIKGLTAKSEKWSKPRVIDTPEKLLKLIEAE